MEELLTPQVTAFIRRMRQERVAAGLTQAELAARVSRRAGHTVHTSIYTRMEQGARAIRLSEAVAIAEELGVSLSSLLYSRDAVDDELAQLRQDLAAARWRADQIEEELDGARVTVRGIEQRIADLERTPRG